MDQYEVIKFKDNEFEMDVNVSPKEETVWLTQIEIAELFEKDRKTITRHIQNILKEYELMEKQVCSKKEHTASDGKLYSVNIYNLDMIIAIGYRVKSKRAIFFRQWATKVLKQYLLNGYVINENRVVVSNENYIELRNEVASINNRLIKVEDKVYYLDKDGKEQPLKYYYYFVNTSGANIVAFREEKGYKLEYSYAFISSAPMNAAELALLYPISSEKTNTDGLYSEIYSDAEQKKYVYLIPYTEPKYDFVYVSSDPANYDYVREDAKYTSADKIKE